MWLTRKLLYLFVIIFTDSKFQKGTFPCELKSLKGDASRFVWQNRLPFRLNFLCAIGNNEAPWRQRDFLFPKYVDLVSCFCPLKTLCGLQACLTQEQSSQQSLSGAAKVVRWLHWFFYSHQNSWNLEGLLPQAAGALSACLDFLRVTCCVVLAIH